MSIGSLGTHLEGEYCFSHISKLLHDLFVKNVQEGGVNTYARHYSNHVVRVHTKTALINIQTSGMAPWSNTLE